MAHRKSEHFRAAFDALPAATQKAAVKSFKLLKKNPNHPSLHFKKVGPYWSARAGAGFRALAVEREYGFL